MLIVFRKCSVLSLRMHRDPLKGLGWGKASFVHATEGKGEKSNLLFKCPHFGVFLYPEKKSPVNF